MLPIYVLYDTKSLFIIHFANIKWQMSKVKSKAKFYTIGNCKLEPNRCIDM